MNSKNQEREGVIKFHLEFKQCDAITPAMIQDITPWREKLFALKLIGQDPLLYDGLGYGNLSHRIQPGSEQFVITGSQTSYLPVLTARDYALVEKSIIDENRLVASGLVKPSSEALTHSAFYHASQDINYVFHVHSATIWSHAKQLGIPVTSPSVSYGTPQMAEEIQKLFNSAELNSHNIVAMGGHRDGIIAFGKTAEQAGDSLLSAMKESNCVS